jgi:hypothetical protein
VFDSEDLDPVAMIVEAHTVSADVEPELWRINIPQLFRITFSD